jgi:hypothetical protein
MPRMTRASTGPWATSPGAVVPLAEPVTGWRIDPAWGRPQQRAQLGWLVNGAQPSSAAICRLARRHDAVPAPDCGCGYWLARDLPTLGALLPDMAAAGALLPGGVAQALVRVHGLGTAAGVTDTPDVLRVAGLAYAGAVVLHASVAHLAGRVALRFGGTVDVADDLFSYASTAM